VIERVLLIVNSASGTGSGPALPGELLRGFRDSAGRLRELELALVRDHPAARLAAASFLGASDAAAAVIAGGGGGTLRGAVEGVFDAGAACRTRIGALRMGSGNVIARRLGVDRDPLTGIRQLGTAIRFGRAAARPIIRCELGTASGDRDVRYAAVMCGLGQWGRTSGDLARWHRVAPFSRAALAAAAGIERVNHLEYVAAAGGRLLEAAVRPAACEEVEVSYGGHAERYRLLAGAAMTMRISGIPFDPQVEPEEMAAGVLLVSRDGRIRRVRLGAGETLAIRLLDRNAVEFFLDEDPEVAHREISLDVAGNLSFLEVAA
jgi:hypothetical protein